MHFSQEYFVCVLYIFVDSIFMYFEITDLWSYLSDLSTSAYMLRYNHSKGL